MTLKEIMTEFIKLPYKTKPHPKTSMSCILLSHLVINVRVCCSVLLWDLVSSIDACLYRGGWSE